MKPIYVPYAGDLYEIHFDSHGEISEVYVSRDNCSRIPSLLDPDDLPPFVKEQAVNQFLGLGT